MPTYTFYPDPSVETTSVDGFPSRASSNETFTTIRTSAGTTFSDSSTTISLRARCDLTVADRYRELTRIITVFDTSSITDTDTVDSATISLYNSSIAVDTSMNTWKMGVTSGTTASNTAVASGDYANNTSSTRLCDTDITVTSITSSAYNDFVLNATGLAAINNTSVTKFAFKFDKDIDAASPTCTIGETIAAHFASADTALTTSDPKLVVNTTAASSTFIPKIIIM